jgi:hypothetical protein
MIHSLKLLENHITVTLSDGMRHLLPPVPGQKRVEVQQVELDLGLSAFSNAQLYYTNKKQHAQKQQKAESASALALKAAERKTNVALSAVDQRARIQKSRKVFWVSNKRTLPRPSIDNRLSLTRLALSLCACLVSPVGEIPLVHFV